MSYYYKCTVAPGSSMIKHVERAAHDIYPFTRHGKLIENRLLVYLLNSFSPQPRIEYEKH